MQLNYSQQKINYLPNDILSKSIRYRKSIQYTSDYSSTSVYVVFVSSFCYIIVNENTITRFQQYFLDLNY